MGMATGAPRVATATSRRLTVALILALACVAQSLAEDRQVRISALRFAAAARAGIKSAATRPLRIFPASLYSCGIARPLSVRR